MVTLDEGGAGRPYLALAPCAGRAASLAELSWAQAAVRGRGAAWRIVPDTHPHVIHHRLRNGRARTLLVGARSRWIDVDPDERAFTVGVRLRPGVVPLLAGVAAWELRDRSVSIGDALGAAGRAAEQRLVEAETPERARALLVALVAARGGADVVDWRVRGFLARVGDARAATDGVVGAAARDLGVGDRSLRDVCRSYLGLRPKEAHRILRLHRALTATLSGRTDASASAAAGYADQSHLIRESKALLGTTPAAFRSRGRAVSSNTRPFGVA